MAEERLKRRRVEEDEFATVVANSINRIAQALAPELRNGEEETTFEVAVPFTVKMRTNGAAEMRPEICCVCTREGDTTICRNYGKKGCC